MHNYTSISSFMKITIFTKIIGFSYIVKLKQLFVHKLLTKTYSLSETS